MSHFRRRNAQALYDLHYGPNMTPMVDVVMVILIFFMASTAFLGPEWFLKTYVPTRAAAATPGAQPTRLQIILSTNAAKETVATLGAATGLSIPQLEAQLREETRKTSPDLLIVPIKVEPDVSYEDVVRVRETCARLGIVKVGLE